MFEKLKRFWQGDPPPVAATIEDSDLGTLSWSKDDEAWVASPSQHGVSFTLQISGTPEPDAALLRHAKDIVARKEEFVDKVRRVLSTEGASVPYLRGYKDEIEGLVIESVSLSWPERPDDGMIFFDGGREYRSWRCDYVGGVPRGLGFDS
jgi:hypothetical protein